MNKKVLILGAILGMLAIVLGAFAAHGLEKLIDKDAIETFQTGVRYQMYHALLLLFVGSTHFLTRKSKIYIFYLIGVGVLFFSGSIYGLSTNALSGFDFKNIGFVTPIGGFLLILAWIIMLINFIKLKGD